MSVQLIEEVSTELTGHRHNNWRGKVLREVGADIWLCQTAKGCKGYPSKVRWHGEDLVVIKKSRAR